MTRSAVFIDRDNTLIHNDGDLGDPAAVKLIQGAASAIASLRGLGYRIIVVSNQGGVARGVFTEADVDAVNERIAELVEQTSGAVIDRFYYCPYHPKGTVAEYTREHPWRKPAPGMLLAAIEDLRLDAASCWMIGDQMRDIEAGHAAGVRTVLIRHGDPTRAGDSEVEPDVVASNLVEAVRAVAQHRRSEREPTTAHTATGVVTTATAPTAAAGDTKPTQPGNAGAPASPPRAPRKPVRPFKPWTIQPVIVPLQQKPPADEPPATDTPAAGDAPAESTLFETAPPASAPEAASPAPAPAAPPAAPVSPSTSTASEASPEVESHAAAALPAVEAEHAPASVAEASEPVAAAPHRSRAGSDQQVELLQQIVRQLKRQHAEYEDFSTLKMLAFVFQMLVVGCVLFGVLNLSQPTAFLEWIAGGILSQLLVITLLILHWQR